MTNGCCHPCPSIKPCPVQECQSLLFDRLHPVQNRCVVGTYSDNVLVGICILFMAKRTEAAAKTHAHFITNWIITHSERANKTITSRMKSPVYELNVHCSTWLGINIPIDSSYQQSDCLVCGGVSKTRENWIMSRYEKFTQIRMSHYVDSMYSAVEHSDIRAEASTLGTIFVLFDWWRIPPHSPVIYFFSCLWPSIGRQCNEAPFHFSKVVHTTNQYYAMAVH